MITTHSASKVAMEDHLATMEDKLKEVTQCIKTTVEQLSARLDFFDKRLSALGKNVSSLSGEVWENSSRIWAESEVEQRQNFILGRSLQKPITFDGSVPWELYKLQFDMLAEMNCWNENDRAMNL